MNTEVRLAFAAIAFLVLVWLAAITVVGYVAVHFVTKFW